MKENPQKTEGGENKEGFKSALDIGKEAYLQKETAMTYALPLMRGTAKAVLELDEEARDMVFREVGKAWCESFVETSNKTWKTDGLSDVATAAMAGLFKGEKKLDKENKSKVLRARAKACFFDHLEIMGPGLEAAGIKLELGTFTVDSAIQTLSKFLKLREIKTVEDTIFWCGHVRRDYDTCCCPIYRSGIIEEPDAETCEDAVEYMKYQFEYLTGIPMEAELVDTLNFTNSDDCKFRVHAKPTQIAVRNKGAKEVVTS